MTYQVLARKWRPRFFREMVGQEHVLKALINALDHNRLHQAYLFTGTRGVGKTTIARILAKCLNCETGVTSEPCGTCSSCVEISQGSFVDLIEIDAASHTGVDNMRAITDNAQYTPSKGRYKVYLIDEVHMLTQHSFNALLKTLEEPPEHAKFLLATTDPQKLPATVLSRCLQFHLKNMVPERIVSHLQHILERESIQAEESALWSLARAAQGSMRDALSLTDQAIAFGQGRVMTADVAAMLGTIDQQTVYKLCEALIEHDAAKILNVVSEASELSPDYGAILDALLLLLHRMTVAQLVPDAVDNSEGDKEQVISLAQQISAGELQLFYQMGLLGKRDLFLAPDLRTGLEMAVLRMLAFRPQNVKEPVSGVQLSQGTAVKKPEAVTAIVTPAHQAPADNRALVDQIMQTETARGETIAPKVEQTAPLSLPENSTISARMDAVLNAPSVHEVDAPIADAKVAVQEKELDEAVNEIAHPLPQNHQSWLEQFSTIPFNGLLKAVASECVLLRVDGNKVVLGLEQNRALYNERHGEQIAQVLSAWCAMPIEVRIEVAEHGLQTPTDYLQVQKDGRRDAALAVLHEDAIVQYFTEQYQAQLVPESLVVKGERL